MTARGGRQLIERVLDHLNCERGRTYPFSKEGLADWYAYFEASETCAEIIRNWNRPAHARKAAA